MTILVLVITSICSIFLYSYFSEKNDSINVSTEEQNEFVDNKEYNNVSFNIELGSETYFWATKTPAKNLKDLIKDFEGDEFFKTSEVDGEFKIDSYRGVSPVNNEEWIFILEHCGSVGNFCTVENFEDLEINKNLNFFVILGEKSKLEF